MTLSSIAGEGIYALTSKRCKHATKEEGTQGRRGLTKACVYSVQGIHDGMLERFQPNTLLALGSVVETEEKELSVLIVQLLLLEIGFTHPHEGP